MKIHSAVSELLHAYGLTDRLFLLVFHEDSDACKWADGLTLFVIRL